MLITIKSLLNHCWPSPAFAAMQARELAWDVERQCLAPLEPMLRLRLHNEVSDALDSWVHLTIGDLSL